MSDGRSRLLLAGAGLALLAIGVVLGSGPLRSAVLGSSGGEIDRLQAELVQAQAATDSSFAQTMTAWDYIDAAAPAMLDGLLGGADVLIVRAPLAAGGVDEGLARRIVQGSGTAVGAVSTADGWTDPASAPFRDALAEQLAPSLVGVETSDPEAVLAHAFVQGATGAAPSGTDLADVDAAGADRGAVLWDLLTQAGLVSGDAASGVDAVIIVAGGGDGTAALVDAFASYDAPVVVIGPQGAVAPFEAADEVATVVDGELYPWGVSAVAALAEGLRGVPSHYGVGELPAILGVSSVPDTTGG